MRSTRASVACAKAWSPNAHTSIDGRGWKGRDACTISSSYRDREVRDYREFCVGKASVNIPQVVVSKPTSVIIASRRRYRRTRDLRSSTYASTCTTCTSERCDLHGGGPTYRLLVRRGSWFVFTGHHSRHSGILVHAFFSRFRTVTQYTNVAAASNYIVACVLAVALAAVSSCTFA